MKDSLGIAYNNLGLVYNLRIRKQINGIRVIPIDLNSSGEIDKEENFYTNLDELLMRLQTTRTRLPPTGDLTFIYKDTKLEVKAFVQWILAKGQRYNNKLGFLQLRESGK